MKKLGAIIMAMMLTVGCAPTKEVGTEEVAQTNQATEQTSEESSNQLEVNEAIEEPFVLKHTQNLVDKGFADITLDKMPESVVSMSTGPVLALHEMGVNLVAVPSTKTMEYPEDLKAEVLPPAMSDDFDLEKIITLQPDLVIVPETSMEQHGKVLQDAGLNVYAVSLKGAQGQSIYDFTKEQIALYVEAFGTNESAVAAGKAIMERFVALEAEMEEVAKKFEGKTFLGVTVVNDTDFYIQGPTSTIGSIMEMLGFTNLYTQEMGSTSTLNLESIVGIETDLMLFTTQMKTAEEAEAIVNSAIAANPPVWNTIPAIERGDTVNLTSSYIVTAGTKIIDSIYAVIGLLEETLE